MSDAKPTAAAPSDPSDAPMLHAEAEAAEPATSTEVSAAAPEIAEVASAPRDSTPEALESPFAFLYGGHALRVRRGGATILAGCLAAFLLMARETQVQQRWGVPLGFVFVVLASIGALDFIGSFDDVTGWVHARANALVGSKDAKRSPAKTDALRPWPTSLPAPRIVSTIVDASVALKPFALTLASLLTAMTIMGHAVGVSWGLAATVFWIATCAFGFKTLAALGIVDESERPLLKRHGFWLIVFCAVLYMPTLGAHSLVDPWETHYGEVSREVLSRDDWITIWWAEEGYFLSKPILDFWMQALAMATFGVAFAADKHAYLPDRILAPNEIHGEPMHPEWIVRLPSLTLSVVALYLAYRAIAQIRGRRAGMFGALILATMADWAMLSHQSITDMPFVASLTGAMSLLIIGLTMGDEATVRAVPVRFFGQVRALSGFHLALGIVLVCAVPQMLYLISRNFTILSHGGPIAGWGLLPHVDEFHSGEGHKCWSDPATADTLDALLRIGKWKCEQHPYAHPEAQPALLGVIGLALLGVLLFINRNERRIARLCFIVAWVFAGISTMGKGIAGIAMPVLVVGVYILAANKWREVLRLEIVSGLIVILTVAMPWYIAMYVRMGDEFYQQLIIHHMIKRSTDHVHDTNVGDDVSIRYYVWQLGYGMFPWSGLVPAGLVWWARTRWSRVKEVLSTTSDDLGARIQRTFVALTSDDEKKRDVATFLIMWFVFSFGLFTKMPTKFHHYIFPALPPAAMLLGIFLDDAIGARELTPKGVGAKYLGIVTAGAAVMAIGFSKLIGGPLFGRLDFGKDLADVNVADIAKLVEANHPASPVLGVVLALGGVALILAAPKFAGARLEEDPDDNDGDDTQTQPIEVASGPSARALATGALALAAALITVLVTRDLASRPDADIKGQERLIQLYTYRYDRIWPKDVYFSNALFGFGIAIVALMLVMVVRAYRRQAIVALVALSTLFTAWTLDDYMVKVAPHWGQRPLFAAYYHDRRSTEEPLVAFEMNWKGENFYSGGGLVEFGNSMAAGNTASERGSDRMREWLAKIKTKAKALYFVTEKSRVGKIEEMLKGVLGAAPNGKGWTEQITHEADDNKFIVVRVRFS